MPDPPSTAQPDQYSRQALAAAWAAEQVGSSAWNQFCQQFVENAYSTTGRYPSAAAAQSALNRGKSLKEAVPGDLVYFRADDSNSGYGHAGIYLGNGQMVSATPQGVKVSDILSDAYYGPRFIGVAEAPPDWKGQPSTPELQKGAQRLLANVAGTGTGGSPVPESPALKTLRAQLEENKTAEEVAQRRLLQARSELRDAKDAVAAQGPAAAATGKNDAALKQAEQAVQAASEAYDKAFTRRQSTETNIAKAETEAPSAAAGNPYSTTNTTSPKLFNEQTGTWVDNPNYTAPGAAATNAQGQTAEQLQLEQATLALAQARRAYDEAGSPEAQAQKKLALETAQTNLAVAQANLAKASTPNTVTVNGTVYPIDPKTGLPDTTRGVSLPQAPSVQAVNGRAVGVNPQTGEQTFSTDLLTPAERALADLHDQAQSAADQYKVEQAALVKRLSADYSAGRITSAEATKQLDAFESMWSAQARQMQQQEARLRAQTMSEQTGQVYDPATGKPTGEMTAAEKERQRTASLQERQTAETARANAAREAETARGNTLQAGTSLYNSALQASQSAGDAAMRTALGMLPSVAPKGTAEDLAGLQNAFATGSAPPVAQARTMPVPNFLNIGRQVASQVLAELSPTAKAYLDAAHPTQRLPGVGAITIPPFGGQQPGAASPIPGALPGIAMPLQVNTPGIGAGAPPPFRAPAPNIAPGAGYIPSERG